MHEAKLYDQNSFLTLTYDDAHLPEDRSLRYSDFQKFMRALRKHAKDRKIRFYMSGEYGGETGRPHYHAIVFNWDFPDKLYFKKSREFRIYTSKLLSELWPHGNHWIGSVTFESAAYVARYCLEKITGDLAEQHYQGRTPEFNKSSNRPGIGAPWLSRFMTDVYPNGMVVVNGKLAKAPRYYDKLFKRGATLQEKDDLEYKRFEMSQITHPEDNTDERLAVREQVALARLNLFKRSL